MKLGGMGWIELLIILVVVLLIFGPKNLPKIGKALGKTVKNVRDGVSGADEEKPAEATETAEVAQELPAAAAPAEVAVPIQQAETAEAEADAQQS